MIYANLQSYRQAWADAYTQDPPVPLNVDIELASVCNLTCPFCFISDENFEDMIRKDAGDGRSRRRLMPKQMAFRIIRECGEIGVPAIKLNWRGESTLHPDYAEIAAYARREGILEVLANSNFNCSDSAVDGLMHTTKAMASLDSLNPETYQVMRRGGSLEKAKEVIHKVIQMDHKNLWIRRVLSKDNRHEDFAGQVRKEFGPSVNISEHFCFDRNADSSHESPGCDHDDSKRIFCGYPAQRIVCASSGLCYPCCIDLHETMPVGDINKQSLPAIWNGEPMRKLRRELRSGIYSSDACRNCQSWMSHDAPQRNFVQDVEVKA